MKKKLLNSFVFIFSFLIAAWGIQSCTDTTTPPQPTDESELITTLKVELSDSGSGQNLNYFFRDPDGEGANPPAQWDTIALDTGRIYTAAVKFLNESNPNAVVNVTAEVKAEQNNHIICYSVNQAKLSITRTDSDGTYPVGIESKWRSGGASSGDLTIVLKHQAGIKNGGCTAGETDVEVKFPLRVK